MTHPFALRVEPVLARDLADAAAGIVHDPLWMLTRQWQLGEFQGENASSPVKVDVFTAERELAHVDSDAVLAGCPTRGSRRSRGGRLVDSRASTEARPGDSR